jgi:uncharacterized protein (TIGR04255 family)
MSVAEFAKEPLTEVVFGVEFNALDFSSVHFGLYWKAIEERFPTKPLDRPPVGKVELFNILPKLRRVWFESEDKKQLIQLQANRFHYNWRRQSQNDEYPHYADVYPRFIEEWTRFKNWWAATEGTPLQPVRYELTYLNQIDENFGWSGEGDYHKVFSIVGQPLNELPVKPSAFNCSMGFILPEEQGDLTVRIDQGVKPKDGSQVVILNLTASHGDTDADIGEWFEAAHKSIVNTFLSLISQEAKDQWGFKWLE